MIRYEKVQKLDGKLVVIIPEEEIERLGVVDGDQIGVSFQRIEESEIPEDMKAAFEESLKRSDSAYRYLSGR